ncbi:MAG: thiamine-phosphate kinase [Candidatus Omnitrophica bacterium]|nr:thiamine-phosphate kinase [Candidatus Omnitrophota bacterium]
MVKRLSDIGERGLIRRIAWRLHAGRSVIRGIGDDCAVLKGDGDDNLLFASDMLVERVHFNRSMPPFSIGWKALAVNLSDIAAMGGRPEYAVVSLGMPPALPVAFLDGIYRGIEKCARSFGVSVVGGDMNRSERIVIDVAVIGRVKRRAAVYRSGARPGDHLLVTGRLGGSFRSGRHLRFRPRVREAAALCRRWRIHAMIDLSDGLGVDLDRLCEASRTGAEVRLDRIPRPPGVSRRGALTDGEDFELLMAVPRNQADRILRWARKRLRCGLTRIGEVVPRGKKERVRFLDSKGRPVSVAADAFRHF